MCQSALLALYSGLCSRLKLKSVKACLGILNTEDCLILKDGTYRFPETSAPNYQSLLGKLTLTPTPMSECLTKISIHLLHYKILRSEYKFSNVNMYIWVGCERLTVHRLC
jgi:hypothetical protein